MTKNWVLTPDEVKGNEGWIRSGLNGSYKVKGGRGIGFSHVSGHCPPAINQEGNLMAWTPGIRQEITCQIQFLKEKG